MIRKIFIGDKEYSFEITNRTVLKIDEVYGNCGSVFDGIVNAKQYYTNSLKLLSCSCIEKEWEFDEISDAITGEQLYYSLPGISMNLILDYIGINKTNKEVSEDGKNIVAS